MKLTPLALTTIYHHTASGPTLVALLVTSDLQHAITSYTRSWLDEADSDDAEILHLQPSQVLQHALQPGDQVFTPTQGYELSQDGEMRLLHHRNALLTILNVDGHEAHERQYRLALPADTGIETWLNQLTEEQHGVLPLLGNSHPLLDIYGQLTLQLWWESEDHDKRQERLLEELHGLETATGAPD